MNTHLCKIALACIILAFWAPVSFSLDRLVIPGTGDSQELLRAVAAQFTQEHPDISFDIPDSVGSIGGIKRVLNGHAPLARIARPLNSSEVNSGLNSLTFAYTPVVFVANLPEICVDNLSTADIVAIYSGKITSWQALGNCPDHKIYVANREEGDSSRLLIEASFPAFTNITKFAGEVVYSTPETLHIIEDYQYTVGYQPQAMLKNSALTQFSINNLQPTAENLVNNKYPLAVPLGFTWKGDLPDVYRQFVEFMFSSRGQEIIRAHDAIPVPKPAEI